MMIDLGPTSLAKILLLILCSCSFIRVNAQEEKDFATRFNIAADWEPTKHTHIQARYRLNLDDNSSRFKRSLLSVSAAYDVTKWLRVGGEYRYNISPVQDFHRVALYLRGDYHYRKWDFRYRLQYQQAQDYYFQPEYLERYQPERVVRNRFMIGYDYTRKLNIYTYAEAFSELEDKDLNFYRMRYGVGANYMYKRRHSIGAELFANDEFNLNRPEDVITVELGYVYHFTKKKKKKKKHKVADP